MITMLDYEDIVVVNDQLKQSQDVEHDNRELVREDRDFLNKEDGQWDNRFLKSLSDKPKMTFDLCNGIVDGIVGEIESADFDIRVRPAGGDATKDLAKTYDGLIRNIETISNASRVYSMASRRMVGGGIGGWEVAVDYVDADSFDQDFIIRPVNDFENRVWFDVAAVNQDASDANHVFVLDSIAPNEYEERFPEGSKQSVGSDKSYDSYEHKPDLITVGRIIYKKEHSIDLVRMSDGSVYEANEEFESVVDDLAEQGITVERTKKKKTFKIFSRLFDGGGFLNDPQETVFKDLPIVPIYSYFDVNDGKIVYRSAIRKSKDAQRSYNAIRSRELEDVMLSPPVGFLADRNNFKTPTDAHNFANMSSGSKRVWFAQATDKGLMPQQIGGAVIQSGLQQSAVNSLNDITATAARAPIQTGEATGNMSGVAIQSLQNKGDTSTAHHFNAISVGICQTAKILVNAIPAGYDSTTRKRILNEDGSYEIIDIMKPVVDMDTQQTAYLNDLSQGKYDVTCEVGEAFKNRQQESVKSFLELFAISPEAAAMGVDLLAKNINAPNVDILAERLRKRQLESGRIPESQWTDEEREEIQQMQQMAAQQPPEQSAEDKIAEAEIGRVQAETADVQMRAQLKQEELRIKEQKDLLDAQNKAEKLQMEELTLMMKRQQQQLENQQAILEANLKGQAQVFETLNTQANTLKTLKDAMGVDAIVGDNNMEAYIQQAETITEQQDNIDNKI